MEACVPLNALCLYTSKADANFCCCYGFLLTDQISDKISVLCQFVVTCFCFQNGWRWALECNHWDHVTVRKLGLINKYAYYSKYTMCYIWNDLQLGKLKANCLLLNLKRKLRKMFLSPRRESNLQPSDLGWDAIYESASYFIYIC